ncbi:MAG: DUF6378 domain-containing protein [Acidobacteriota bacterium]
MQQAVAETQPSSSSETGLTRPEIKLRPEKRDPARCLGEDDDPAFAAAFEELEMRIDFDWSILEEARKVVSGARMRQYGLPEDCLVKIGRVWGALLGIPDIPPRAVCHMMTGLKMVRDVFEPKRDNSVDAVGYELCATKFGS